MTKLSFDVVVYEPLDLAIVKEAQATEDGMLKNSDVSYLNHYRLNRVYVCFANKISG